MLFEKVSPSHPDKIADRIAGALVDLAYTVEDNPKIAVEVLIGHGVCHIISETSVHFDDSLVAGIVKRIAGDGIELDYKEVPQDAHLAANQDGKIRCGDNGIFKGVPTNDVERILSKTVRALYEKYPTDGKYILSSDYLGVITACQSCVNKEELEDEIEKLCPSVADIIANPLGDWTGGINVDTGATNRKLGSDMGRAVTGGGLHGKDLSKADVAVNIWAHLRAQATGNEINLHCAIGDDTIDGTPYSEIVEIARNYINELGGFEKLAEWGLI